jgi:hypothetical protein
MRNLYWKFNSEARATDYLSAALLVLATRWSQCAFKTISRKTLLTGNGNFSDFSAGVGEACCWSLVKTKRLLISRLRVFRTDIQQCVYLYFACIISSWQSFKLLHPSANLRYLLSAEISRAHVGAHLMDE